MVSGDPLTVTTEVDTYPVPVTVILAFVPPATKAVGLREVTPGVGLLTVNGTLFELPPFGCGLMTAISSVPAFAKSEPRTVATREVALTKNVLRGLPFTVTVASDTKLLPITVRLRLALPTEVPDGESELICGTGLGPGLMMNVSAVVVPPPGVGVITSIAAWPAFWISVERICAAILVVLEKIVMRGEPFHNTVDCGVKPEPITAKLKAGWPARILVGDSAVR